MDRIQSAIEKARKARGQRLATAGAAPVVAPDAAAAWAALTAVTPGRRALERGRIVAAEPGPAAIAFDVMRTKLLQQLRSQGWRRVVVTSPGSACGKTMTCLNLAFSLARQSDLRVMVVEFDLRRPAILATLGLKARTQFAAALEGREAPEAHMLRLGPNLALAANHTAVRHPAELLQGPQTAAVLAAVEARYAPDVVLFDMPPMLVSDDTIAFLGQADCALLVAAAERSTLDEIDRCEQDLAARTGVLGVVLNKCRFLGPEASYAYDY